MVIANMIVEKDEKLLKYAADLADKCGTAKGERCDQAFSFAECLHNSVIKDLDSKAFEDLWEI